MLILFTGGGTLGSVTPLLAVAAELKRRDPKISLHWFGTATGPERPFVEAAGLAFHALSSGKLRRYFSWKNFVDLWRITRGFFEARRLLTELHPDLVVSAGGFVAVPVVWAAATLRIPIHIHQLDLRPGLANRLTAPFAASVSVTYDKSLRDYRRAHPVWTGSPVRSEIFGGVRADAERLWGLEPGRPVVLVVGGGTGASGLNELARRATPFLAERVEILHVTGAGKAEVSFTHPHYRQVELLTDDLKHAFAAADVVVTRAGIGFLTELAALGKAMIIVPMPGTHQEENAAYFAAAGAAVVLNEKITFSKAFADEVLALLNDSAKRQALATAALALNRADAAERLADLLLADANRDIDT
ncbi:MAG: glycosyltransferase [Patescibacteria group bacterium]|nr:glycosyltransferase [Patescibacteria group bacterium]